MSKNLKSKKKLILKISKKYILKKHKNLQKIFEVCILSYLKRLLVLNQLNNPIKNNPHL